jgi:hypothetical protein
MSMKTILVSAAAAATLLAGSVTSASAQPYGGSYWGPRSYARMSYTEFFRQLRACQRHDRLHRELGGEHRYEHEEGLESRGDHRDLHGALGEAHDAYHYDNRRADFCNRMIRASRYRDPYGYWNRNYGNSSYGFGMYGNGNGYGFGFYGR